jgi:hypothetical protein
MSSSSRAHGGANRVRRLTTDHLVQFILAQSAHNNAVGHVPTPLSRYLGQGIILSLNRAEPNPDNVNWFAQGYITGDYAYP